MQKTKFRATAVIVARSNFDVERERGNWGKSDAVVKTVTGEALNPFIDLGRQYKKYVARELLRHAMYKCDLVIGLACFDYTVLFKLKETVAVDCYQHVFQSFSSRGWLARELRNVHMDDHAEFLDDVRHLYLDQLRVGLAVEDKISLLSSCPQVSQREYTWNLFKLCCLCLNQVASKLPYFALRSSNVGVTGVDLSCVIEPIQEYLLSCDTERNFFIDPESFSTCLELVETFCDRALQSDYSLCESIDVHGKEKIGAQLEKSYKTGKVASDVESFSSLSDSAFVSDKLPEQRRRPAQRPRIDIGKTHQCGVVDLLAGKLRSKRKTSGAELSSIVE